MSKKIIKASNCSIVDYAHTLPGDFQVVQAQVLVSPLQATDFQHTLVGAAYFFTGGNGRAFECMWTHFAVALELENGEVFVVERTDSGVHLHPRSRDHSERLVWAGKLLPWVKLQCIIKFCEEEGRTPYSFTGKNCKHLAYDFFQKFERDEPLGDFGCWFEDQYRNMDY